MDEERGAYQAIYATIRMLEEALQMEFPRGCTPSESREIMVAILARTVADLRDAAAKNEVD